MTLVTLSGIHHDMIEFITLFLGGLVTGPRTIELMAGDSVEMVEVRLDGEVRRRLDNPPWKLELDFGPELVPHLLEALALDASRREIGRVEQWINMSPRLAQSSVVIDGAERGRDAVARVSWASLAETNQPIAAEAYFDGRALTIDDPHSIPLPTFDPSVTHHLRVRLEFSERLFSEAEVVFGGIYGSEVSSEISAIPIWFTAGKRPPSAGEMSGWFTVEGVPQKIHATEQGLAEIVVVRDSAAIERLQKLSSRVGRLATDIHLRKDIRISFVSPCPQEQVRDGFSQVVFPRSQRYSSSDGTLLKLLVGVTASGCTEERQQLADAVAVAGLTATEDGLRRMVILILGESPKDQSEFTPAQVTTYLRRLRAPLEIWSVAADDGPVTPWSATTHVYRLRQLDRAFSQIKRNLERQQIVWLEGLHLPQSIELHPEAVDVELVE